MAKLSYLSCIFTQSHCTSFPFCVGMGGKCMQYKLTSPGLLICYLLVEDSIRLHILRLCTRLDSNIFYVIHHSAASTKPRGQSPAACKKAAAAKFFQLVRIYSLRPGTDLIMVPGQKRSRDRSSVYFSVIVRFRNCLAAIF